MSPSTLMANCHTHGWPAWARVPTDDQSVSDEDGTEATSEYHPLGVPDEGAGVDGCEALRRKMMSSAEPSDSTLTGALHESTTSMPAAPSMAATARDSHTGADPEGTPEDQPDGGVSTCKSKLNEPPVGVAGVVSLRR
jgi:hypothetical protein